MSVLGQLLRDTDDESAPTHVQDELVDEQEGEEEAEATEDKTAAARDILLGVDELQEYCSSLAASFREGMAKTASEGGDVTDEQQNADFFERVALTLSMQSAYARGIEKTAAQNSKVVEALKLASDLISAGQMDVPEGKTMFDVVTDLATKDLRVVKAASEMFGEQALANTMGEVEKRGTERPEKLDGSMSSWLDAHKFLME